MRSYFSYKAPFTLLYQVSRSIIINLDLLCYSGSGVQRDQDNNSYFGPGFSFAQLWAKQRAGFIRSGQNDMVEIFTLPIGVKFSSEMCSNHKACSESDLPETSSKMYSDPLHTANFSSRDQLSDNGLEALTEIYNIAFKVLKRRNVDEPRKRGLLSERAASMLVIYFHLFYTNYSTFICHSFSLIIFTLR